MDDFFTPSLHLHLIIAGWAALSTVALSIASGKFLTLRRWTHPEHRLMTAGIYLILLGLLATQLVVQEFDAFMKDARWQFVSALSELKKSGRWDEVEVEILRFSMERTVEKWSNFREDVKQLVLLVAGGVGGGLIAQGIIEKHHRDITQVEAKSARPIFKGGAYRSCRKLRRVRYTGKNVNQEG